ncbi:MAG TPA: outer membrane beta-barrel protein [Bacteroidia bacterium]|jgi:hypothetical protein|nr:outer membrane beta-barrel protein [Bacteroidia bacterium]
MIKKILLAAIIVFAMQSFAQNNKGQLLVSGSLNYYTNKSNRSDSYNLNSFTSTSQSNQQIFGASLQVGYFVTNHLAVGLGGWTYHRKSSYTNTNSSDVITSVVSKDRDTDYTVGPFLRYNQTLFKSKFGFFLNLNSSYAYTDRHNETVNYNSTDPNSPFTNKYQKVGNGFDVALAPGLFYFINSRISLETTLGSVYFSNTDLRDPGRNSTYKEHYVGSSFSIASIWLGATFYLGRNKNTEND